MQRPLRILGSGHSTAAGILAEIAKDESTVQHRSDFRVKSIVVSVGTSFASTVPIRVLGGKSSVAPPVLAELMMGGVAGTFQFAADISAPYVAVESTIAPAGNGVAVTFLGE